MSRFLDPGLQNTPVYVPGEQPQDGISYVKLNTNESPYPPSPQVLAALSPEAISRLNLYPDPNMTQLRQTAATYFSLTPDMVLPVNGSDEGLAFAFQALFRQHGVVCPAITYGFYGVLAGLYGVAYHKLPLTEDYRIDWRQYANSAYNIVIANPNAPTGIALNPGEAEAIVAANPDRVVLLDEAYIDFGGESAVPLTKKYDNLLVVRTFSKSRSLAGARLGLVLGNAELIADLERIRAACAPYNVSRLTQAAGVAALQDDAYFRTCVERIRLCRNTTALGLRTLGCQVLDSAANFVFARYPHLTGAEFYAALRRQGILVRYFNVPELDGWVRISIGSADDTASLLHAVKQIVVSSEGGDSHDEK